MNNTALSMLRRNMPNISFGLDALIDSVERFSHDPMPSRFPPYNILRQGTDYIIEMAVAGFDERHINVTHDKMKHTLTITGSLTEDDKLDEDMYVYRGLSNRNFTLEFFIGDHYEVEEAALSNGKLMLRIHKDIPVEMLPRQIEIKPATLAIENKPKEKAKRAA